MVPFRRQKPRPRTRLVYRDLNALTDLEFDVLVIGGGIVGACVAWDAALRGLSVALVEKNDFASGASSNSLKIVHGGLRYLQQLDFRRMRESSRERSIWLRIAPHLIDPLPIVVPAYSRSLQARAPLLAASAINDSVAWDRNRGLLSDKILPAGRVVSRSECLELAPELASPQLTGGLLFHDAQMYSSERLALEVLQAATTAGAQLANYVEVDSPVSNAGDGVVLEATDAIGNDRLQIRAKSVVNAAGSAAPHLAARFTSRQSDAIARYSVAMNVLVGGLGHSVAFAIPEGGSPDKTHTKRRRRQLFVVPWRDASIIGTGHYFCESDEADFELSESLVAKFLEEVNRAWPREPFTRANVRLVHAGLLPLATGHAGADVRLLRRHRVIDHSRDGAPRFITAISVKYTTARLVAESTVDHVFKSLGSKPPLCLTARTPLPGAHTEPAGELISEAQRKYGDILAEDIIHHLVRTYGRRYDRILAYRDSGIYWNQRLCPESPVIKAQLIHGVREEMALRADDLVRRRTEIGARGPVPAHVLHIAQQVVRSEAVA